MRKFLMAAAIAGLVFAIAAPAMALDFKFGAEYRVRFYDYMNTGFDNNNTTVTQNNPGNVQGRGNPRGVQIRVRPRFDVSDDNGNIQATLRLEYGDTDFGAGGGANGSGFGNAAGNISLAPAGSRFRNGGGGSFGADGVALETKWAYIDFAMPFNVPLRVRAGIQPWYLPKGLIVDDDIAGVRAYGKVAPLSYEAFWFRAAKGPNLAPAAAAGVAVGATFDDTRDNALDYYGVRGDLALVKAFNPGIYYIYGDNRANCSSAAVGSGPFIAGTTCNERVRAQHWIGATATGDLGVATYDIDFVYGSAKGGDVGNYGVGGVTMVGATLGNNTLAPVTVKGWVLDGGIHIPVGPLKLNLLGSYATGDKQNGGDSEAFPMGPAPSWSGVGGQYELIGEGGAFDVVSSATQHGVTNLWMLGATLEYVPVKPLWIKLAYGYAGFSSTAGNCAFGKTGSTGCWGPAYTGAGFVAGTVPGSASAVQGSGGLAGESALGQEFHIRADYTVWTGFKIQTMAGWLIPKSGDTMGKYILQLLYNF